MPLPFAGRDIPRGHRGGVGPGGDDNPREGGEIPQRPHPWSGGGGGGAATGGCEGSAAHPPGNTHTPREGEAGNTEAPLHIFNKAFRGVLGHSKGSLVTLVVV